MKGILYMAGIILLCTEGSMGTYRLARKELKKPVIHANAVQSDLKSLRGKMHRFPHVYLVSILLIGPQKCNEDCYFELGLSSELCKLSSAAAPDENSYRYEPIFFVVG